MNGRNVGNDRTKVERLGVHFCVQSSAVNGAKMAHKCHVRRKVTKRAPGTGARCQIRCNYAEERAETFMTIPKYVRTYTYRYNII